MAYENIKKIRRSKKISQVEIADKVGLTLDRYKNKESGRTLMDVETAKKVAEILGTDLNSLFG